MSESTLQTIVKTVKNAASNLDESQIERLTGQKIDTVDQLMHKTARTGPKNYGRGFLAGVIGGIVGVGVKMVVDHYVAPDVQQIEDNLAENMVNAAEGHAGFDLTDEQETTAEAILEIGIGALIGGIYGLVVEAMPDAQHNSQESNSLLDTTKKIAAPAMGIIPKVMQQGGGKHIEKVAGSAAYAATLEVVRRTTRYYMEEK